MGFNIPRLRDGGEPRGGEEEEEWKKTLWDMGVLKRTWPIGVKSSPDET